MLYLKFRPSLADLLTILRFRNAARKLGRDYFYLSLNEILRSETAFMTDRTTQGHILFGACVLATYRVLRASGLGETEAKDTLVTVVCKIGRWTNAMIMWLVCNLSRNPFRTIEKYSKYQIPRQYGESFAVTHLETPEGFVSEVLVCGYRTFLSRHRATELLGIFCEWDRVWIDALPQKIGFTRPQTQALGANSCLFRFENRSSSKPF